MLLERQFHARHQTEQLLLAPLETEPSAAQEPAPPTVKPRKRDQIFLRELRIVLRTIVNRLLAERRFANVFTKLPVRHEDSVYIYVCVFVGSYCLCRYARVAHRRPRKHRACMPMLMTPPHRSLFVPYSRESTFITT